MLKINNDTRWNNLYARKFNNEMLLHEVIDVYIEIMISEEIAMSQLIFYENFIKNVTSTFPLIGEIPNFDDLENIVLGPNGQSENIF